MVDVAPSREIRDMEGTSEHYNGSVTTTLTAIPAVAGESIQDFMIENRQVQPKRIILVSLDGGTSFKTLDAGGNWNWSPKGYIKQIHIKAGAGTADYEIVMNRGEC